MDQTTNFDVKDGAKIYDVRVTYQLLPQEVAKSGCYICQSSNDGFIRLIVNVEIIDPETTLKMDDQQLHRRIVKKIQRKNYFKSICGDCLNQELDDQVQDYLLQQIEDGE